MSLCVPVTLVHPAKAVGWNEMPFGRDTHVVPIIIQFTGLHSPPLEEEIWGSKPYFAAMLPIAKLLWLFFFFWVAQ